MIQFQDPSSGRTNEMKQCLYLFQSRYMTQDSEHVLSNDPDVLHMNYNIINITNDSYKPSKASHANFLEIHLASRLVNDFEWHN